MTTWHITGLELLDVDEHATRPRRHADVDLYTATRHHFAWYAWNVLELDPADIAQHFGHQDGGELVRKLYGHFDQARARERVRAAFNGAPMSPVPLIREEAA